MYDTDRPGVNGGVQSPAGYRVPARERRHAEIDAAIMIPPAEHVV